MAEDGLTWCTQEVGASYHQWYFNEEPCDVLRVGVREEQVEVIEIRTRAGVVKQIQCTPDGDYPGLAYDDTVH